MNHEFLKGSLSTKIPTWKGHLLGAYYVLGAHCVLGAHGVLGAHCLLALVSFRRYKENKSNSDSGDIPALFFSNIRRFKIWLFLQLSPVEPFLVHEKCLCPGPSRGEGRRKLRLGILVIV